MFDGKDSINISETKVPEANGRVEGGFEKIKPETDMTMDKAKGIFENLFSGEWDNKVLDSDIPNNYETSDRVIESIDRDKEDNTVNKSFCPNSGDHGQWENDKGNSSWKPNAEYVPPKEQTNPEQKTWGEILEKYKIESIPFSNGYPDFSEVSKGTVEIDEYSDKRSDNFSQADEALAKEKECTPQEVREWRKENGYTWHEREDCKTMDKVPTEVHGNIPHEGGISAIKKSGNEIN